MDDQIYISFKDYWLLIPAFLAVFIPLCGLAFFFHWMSERIGKYVDRRKAKLKWTLQR